MWKRSWWIAAAVLAPILLAQVPRDSHPLWVTLRDPVNSANLPATGRIQAVVTAPYSDTQGVRIPAGSILTGKAEGDRHHLVLSFQSVHIGNRDYPVTARVMDVDNARETVKPDGTIEALQAIRKRPSKTELILLAAAHAHPIALALLEGSKLTLHEVERPSIRYPVGTDLELRLQNTADLPSLPPESDVPTAPAELQSLLESLPHRTVTFQGERPSDWVNLAFAGSKQDLIHAFGSAGWKQADQLSAEADVKVFLALADHHSYQHAPVSKLLIDGHLPDLVYQKQTNTFAKRHHIRIWSTSKTWDGRPVWIAAATHDIGIEFSPTSRTFTHRIDSDVDQEREKIINDLSFAGAVRLVFAMDRSDILKTSRNGTGDEVHTDGRLLFIDLGTGE